MSAVCLALVVALALTIFRTEFQMSSGAPENLLAMTVRGFGTGAMHVVCGAFTAVGLLFLWDRLWLRAVGTLCLLALSITFHGIFNILVNQPRPVSVVGSVIPLAVMGVYLSVVRKRINAA